MADDVRRQRNLLKEWYKQIKVSKKCCVCGSRKYLQFHHKEPKTKTCSVSRMVHNGESKEIILAEMDKCIILCRSCHCKHHNKLKSKH